MNNLKDVLASTKTPKKIKTKTTTNWGKKSTASC